MAADSTQGLNIGKYFSKGLSIMRFGELIFLFIFGFMGLIAMIARVIVSKRKEKGEGAAPQERTVSDNADSKDDKELAEMPFPGTVLPTMRTDEGSPLPDSTVRQNSQGILQGGLLYVQNSQGLSQAERVYVSAWEKINQLSPMKRAIILSEILGSPKGFE